MTVAAEVPERSSSYRDRLTKRRHRRSRAVRGVPPCRTCVVEVEVEVMVLVRAA